MKSGTKVNWTNDGDWHNNSGAGTTLSEDIGGRTLVAVETFNGTQKLNPQPVFSFETVKLTDATPVTEAAEEPTPSKAKK